MTHTPRLSTQHAVDQFRAEINDRLSAAVIDPEPAYHTTPDPYRPEWTHADDDHGAWRGALEDPRPFNPAAEWRARRNRH